MEENINVNSTDAEETTAQNQLTPDEMADFIAKAKLEQRLPLGIIAGAAAALLMAVVWAAITVATKYQIGYMAIAVGLVVGFAVRFAGKGIDMIFGISGAVFALLGCFIGNFLSQVGFTANAFEITYFEAFKILSEPSVFVEVMKEAFHPMDVLFYGFAIYEGYRFSFRNLEMK